MNESDIFDRHPLDRALQGAERDFLWGERYKHELKASVGRAITALDLDKPWEEIHKDPVKEALADALFGSVLSSYGPKISEELNFKLNRIRFRNSIHSLQESDPNFTSNHRSVSIRLRSLDSDGNPIKCPVFSYHMPTFATRSDGKPTIGDLSPISISQESLSFQLHLVTPSGYIWRKSLEVITASESSNESVGISGGREVFVRDIASPCVSPYQVMVLRDTCEQKSADCAMCSVPRGNGLITPERWTQISITLDKLMDEAIEKGDTFFHQTLSGGSTNSGDGGFSTGHEIALRLIEEKVKKYNNKIKPKLELEMMLPPDQDEWILVIEKLERYVNDMGWDISLAINMEALPDEWKTLFIPGTKGTLTKDMHKEFAKILRDKTFGKIQMSTLVMFGMKPVEMSYGEYMLADLKLIKELIAAGIHPDYGPCKNDLGTKLEAYPPPDSVFYMVQFLALKRMLEKTNLPRSHGCVGSCGRCHQTEATDVVLHLLKKRPDISLPKIFEKILEQLGPDYTKAFTEIFS